MCATTRRTLLLVPLVFFIMLPGCSTQQLVTEKASSLFREVATSAGRQSDVALVREGTPAYLMLIDGMILSYPDNPQLLLAGAQVMPPTRRSSKKMTRPGPHTCMSGASSTPSGV
jgi:hypothetical protein